MIVTALFGLIASLIDSLPTYETSALDDLFFYAEYFVQYFEAGIDMFIAFAGVNAVRALSYFLVGVILLDAFYFAYSTLWFFIRKIPQLNIRE